MPCRHVFLFCDSDRNSQFLEGRRMREGERFGMAGGGGRHGGGARGGWGLRGGGVRFFSFFFLKC